MSGYSIYQCMNISGSKIAADRRIPSPWGIFVGQDAYFQ